MGVIAWILLGFVAGMPIAITNYLPMAVPFAILIVIPTTRCPCSTRSGRCSRLR